MNLYVRTFGDQVGMKQKCNAIFLGADLNETFMKNIFPWRPNFTLTRTQFSENKNCPYIEEIGFQSWDHLSSLRRKLT